MPTETKKTKYGNRKKKAESSGETPEELSKILCVFIDDFDPY